jgi:hypothetical protein
LLKKWFETIPARFTVSINLQASIAKSHAESLTLYS